MFSSCESFIAIGWKVCAPGRTTSGTPVQFFHFLNFQNHGDHVYNNLWSFIAIRWILCAPSRTTSGTPASIILFYFLLFPKPLRTCLQLAKVSSQSDKRCVLVYGTYRYRHWFFYIFNFHLQQRLKVTSQSMNGLCSCKATSGTPTSTIFKLFKFPKPPRACLK